MYAANPHEQVRPAAAMQPSNAAYSNSGQVPLTVLGSALLLPTLARLCLQAAGHRHHRALRPAVIRLSTRSLQLWSAIR